MKNEQIKSLKDVVPKHIRLSVYKQAIKLIETNQYVSQMSSFGLCLLFPSLLWDLECFTDFAPSGIDWEYQDTRIAFPELTKSNLEKIYYYHDDDKNNIRLDLLKEFVSELEK